jgi:hypothetical protein
MILRRHPVMKKSAMHASIEVIENLRCCADLKFDITQSRLSHETAQTEIERSFNCPSFWSCLMSPRAIDRQRLSFDKQTLELCVSIDETYRLRHGGAAEFPAQEFLSTRIPE